MSVGDWLRSGWLDLALTAAWFVLVSAIGVRVWRRGSGE